VVVLTFGLTHLLFPSYDRLFYAIQTDRPYLVRAALMTGSSPDGCDYLDSHPYAEPVPPLANAVGRNNEEIVKQLLDAGANPNVLFADDTSPLAMALYQSSEDVLKLLLQYRADPLAQTSSGTVIDEALADKKFPNKAHFLVALLDARDPNWRGKGEHPIPQSCVYRKT
jgi:Ankyrin repeats (3 copies)